LFIDFSDLRGQTGTSDSLLQRPRLDARAGDGTRIARRGGMATRTKTSRRKTGTKRYGKMAGEKVQRSMEEMKAGTLRSGRSGKKVTSRQQAIAIGLSEARRAGGKLPAARKSTRKAAKRPSSRRASRASG